MLLKRTADVIGATAGLVVLGPPMAVIAVAVRLSSAGPALFAQERAGKGARPFRLVKFRTMVADA